MPKRPKPAVIPPPVRSPHEKLSTLVHCMETSIAFERQREELKVSINRLMQDLANNLEYLVTDRPLDFHLLTNHGSITGLIGKYNQTIDLAFFVRSLKETSKEITDDVNAKQPSEGG